MLPYLKAFFTDEHAFERLGGIAVLGLGSFLASGAVIPGTDQVVPFLAGPNLANLGKLILVVAGGSAFANSTYGQKK